MIAQNVAKGNQQAVISPTVPPGPNQWYAALRAGEDPGAPTADQFPDRHRSEAGLIYDRFKQAANFKDFESALPIIEQNFPFFRALASPQCPWGGLTPAQFVKERLPAEYADTDKIIQKRELTAFVGQSGTGKSFWALAKGVELADTMPILYVAAEGLNPDRLVALDVYRKKEGKPTVSDQLTIIDHVLDLSNDAIVDSFVEYAATLKPEVIFIDTLAACTGGEDDNTKEAMQPIMNRIRAGIINVLNCAVVLIHHTNKDGKTYRGSTSIRADVANMYYLSEDDGKIILKSDKQRDSEKDANRYYQLTRFETRLHPVTGEQITSAVMLRGEHADHDPSHSLSPGQRKVLEVLEPHDNGLTTVSLRSATSFSPSTVWRKVNELAKAGFVRIGNKGAPISITQPGRDVLKG